MPRPAAEHFTLDDGQHVGFSLKRRGPVWRVKFPHPTKAKEYVELTTGCENKNDAYLAAAKIILKHYRPQGDVAPIRASWDKVIAHLRATPDLRPDSVRAYLTAITAVRSLRSADGQPVADVLGPSGITAEMAHKWKREFLGGTYAKADAADAKRYKRSPATCTTYLRSLRSLWSKHLKPAGYVRDNPWQDVPYPNAPKGKRVRVPEDEAVATLMRWLAARHPRWELPLLFTQTKMVAGCRTLDLCKTLSADLDGLNLTLTAEVTKTRAARTVPLPPALAARLHAVAGPTYLWERSLADSKVHRPSVRTHGQTEYSPSTWRWTIQNLFREFNATQPKKLQVRPHDLRARAITLVAAATQSVDATAEALGVDPQTARHYLDRSKAFSSADIMARLTGALLP